MPLPRLEAVRIDVVSIFPEYFGGLDISLLGKARQSGLVDVAVHDLREHTHDRHRTVDDTPYGGGAPPWLRRSTHWRVIVESVSGSPAARRQQGSASHGGGKRTSH